MDIQEIAALFHIHEKALAHGTALSHIRDKAWNMLREHNHELAPETPEAEAEEPVDDDIEPVTNEPRSESEFGGESTEVAEGTERRGR